MELKHYQERVLKRLSVYLDILKARKRESLNLAEARKKSKLLINWNSDQLNFPQSAWSEFEKRCPLISEKKESIPVLYNNRFSGMGQPVPHICLKVPTGGGKTLLGVAGIERINAIFFEANTGFVLWVTPSDIIYKQTLRILSDRESLHRQILDRVSLGKVRILQKTDGFRPQDAKQYLCVILLMLQSAGRQSKESLRIFRDSGRFPYFFPEVDAYYANRELLNSCENLDAYPSDGLGNVSIKHSLGNVLKLIRPLIVIDEGHRAYTEKAKKALMDFNPRFVLELSATPNKKEHHSNVLVSVSGKELKKEEMIKLPINIFNTKNKDWKKTLTKGYETLKSLSKNTIQHYKKGDPYIRPIMLIRVERTGTDQRGKRFIHSEDVREYLIKNLNVASEEIKVKSSVKDELGQMDLLSEYSKVKYIITKEALKEGWDCPFAYVLVILSQTKTPVAIEQMIGRILRQPYTKRTRIEALNQCYVVCMDQDVEGAAKGVQKGLQSEGIEGLAEDITIWDKGKQRFKRQQKRSFRDLKMILPKVLYRDGNTLRDLSYEGDLLYHVDWSNLRPCKNCSLDVETQDRSYAQVDIKTQIRMSFFDQEKENDILESFDKDFSFICQGLYDIIPNPWDAADVVNQTLSTLKKRHGKGKKYNSRFYILNRLRKDLQNQVSQMTEKIFREKLKNRQIALHLVSTGVSELNWKMAETLEISTKNRVILKGKNHKDLWASLFKKRYKKRVGCYEIEKKAACYLDEDSAIGYWHELVERQNKNWQEWGKDKILPDFLICIKSISRDRKMLFSVLKTKKESSVKNLEECINVFSESSNQFVNRGTLELRDQKMKFNMFFKE